MSQQKDREVEELRERVAELESRDEAREAELRELHALVEALQKKVASNSEQNSEESRPDGVDHYDAAVLERLEPGETVSLQLLRRLYQTNTRITDENTVKKRVKALTKRPEFEHVGSNTWRYRRGEDDD